MAHVDAGKTTITENFLYLSNAINSLGSVDQGSSVTDSMTLEKERGISIKSASVSFNWKDYTINLIDTPGHTDFSAEVERARGELLGMTAEEYRDSDAARRRLKDGLRGLADTARDMARQDAREVVERFGQLGRRKFNLAA